MGYGGIPFFIPYTGMPHAYFYEKKNSCISAFFRNFVPPAQTIPITMQKKKNLELYAAETNSPLRVMLFEDKVHAGFPSPVDDFCLKHSIDLNHELIRHPATTFLARVAGDSMIDEGIDEGDLLVIDRSLTPDEMHLTVCCIDGEFAVKRLKISHGELYLMPGNRQYKPIHVTQDKNFMVWGVVTWVIKKKA